LDTTAGIEHIYVVFSATRWPELEAALAGPSQPLLPAGSMVTAVQEPNRLQTRGIGGTHDMAAPIDATVALSAERINGGKTYKLSVEGRPFQASGAFLVIERWFSHMNRMSSQEPIK